jgi:hypothetical protein
VGVSVATADIPGVSEVWLAVSRIFTIEERDGRWAGSS